MLRRSQKLEVMLDLQAVSCPGVWLPREGGVYLTISLFGQRIRTREKPTLFPVLIRERFAIDKVFNLVLQLTDMDSALESESVFVELVQRLPFSRDVVLATFETSVREFLFPNVSVTPQGSGADLDLLMEPTADFPSDSCPRLEVSTKTTVREVRTSMCKSSSQSNIVALSKSCGVAGRGGRHRVARRPRSISAERIPRCTGSSGITDGCRSHSTESRPGLLQHYWCVSCSSYHVHHRCDLCCAYRRYFGRDYPGHHHHVCCKKFCECDKCKCHQHASHGHCACVRCVDPCPVAALTSRGDCQRFYQRMDDFYRSMYLRAVQTGDDEGVVEHCVC